MDVSSKMSSVVNREDEQLQQLAAAAGRFQNERRPFGMFWDSSLRRLDYWNSSSSVQITRLPSGFWLTHFLNRLSWPSELPPMGPGSPYQLSPSAAAHGASAAAMMAHRHLAAAAAASVKSDPNIKISLENAELWQQFHQIGTEMIITKLGRCVSCHLLQSNQLESFQ